MLTRKLVSRIPAVATCLRSRSISILSRKKPVKGQNPLAQRVSEGFKDAIISLTEASRPPGPPPTVISLPGHLRSIKDPNSQFQAILKGSYVENPTQLLSLYEPLKGSLGLDTTVQLAVSLYRQGHCTAACEVLLENYLVGGLSNLLSVIATRVIPDIVGDDDWTRTSLVACDIVYSLVTELNQTGLAHQLVSALGIGAEMLDHVEAVAGLYESASTNQLLVDAVPFEKKKVFIPFRIDLTFPDSQSRTCIFPQSFGDTTIPLWTRIKILELALTLPSQAVDSLISLIFTRYGVNLFSQKGALAATIRSILGHSAQLQEQQETHRLRQFRTMTINGLARSLKLTKCRFYAGDLAHVPKLAYKPKDVTTLWKAFVRHHRNHNMTIAETRNVLSKFVETSIDHHQSFAVTEVIKFGGQDEWVPSELLAKSIRYVMSAKRSSSIYTDPARAYLDNEDVDTTLLERILKYAPKKTLNRALRSVFHQLQSSDVVSGRFLWNLVLAMQNSSTFETFPHSIERLAAAVVARRPQVEVLRYMSLPKVTAKGVRHALKEYIILLKSANDASEVKLQADAQLILAGLVLIKEKSEGIEPSKTAESGNVDFGSVIMELFNGWDDKRAVELVHLLHSQELDPSPEMLLQTAVQLMNRHKYHLVVKLFDRVPTVPESTIHLFLIRASYGDPGAVTQLRKWMRAKNMQIPPHVLRKMLIGYAYSQCLTAATSARLIAKIIRELHRNKCRIGRKAAAAIVVSTIQRAERTGWGSRTRLEWALRIAYREKVDPKLVQSWFQHLDVMRVNRTGYWSSRYYHRPQFS
uniref:ARAD1D29238p n=1 Tax=Blastobotrys adeninivorans TaxID=409370 RepID=A0A060TGD3_BLAAD